VDIFLPPGKEKGVSLQQVQGLIKSTVLLLLKTQTLADNGNSLRPEQEDGKIKSTIFPVAQNSNSC